MTTVHQLIGNLWKRQTPKRYKSLAKTADFTISAEETGTTFTNEGATGTVVATLPGVNQRAGVNFTFAVLSAQDLSIDPGAGSGIYINGEKLADDTAISSNTIGDAITLESTNDGDWYVKAQAGFTNAT